MSDLSKPDLDYLRQIKKRGRMYGCCYALKDDGLIQEGKTHPDGQGGYVVEYYVISEKGEEYLKQHRKRFVSVVKRILKISKPIIEVVVAIVGLLLMLLQYLKDNGS